MQSKSSYHLPELAFILVIYALTFPFYASADYVVQTIGVPIISGDGTSMRFPCPVMFDEIGLQNYSLCGQGIVQGDDGGHECNVIENDNMVCDNDLAGIFTNSKNYFVWFSDGNCGSPEQCSHFGTRSGMSIRFTDGIYYYTPFYPVIGGDISAQMIAGVASGVQSTGSTLWVIVALAVSIPLTFYVIHRVKGIFEDQTANRLARDNAIREAIEDNEDISDFEERNRQYQKRLKDLTEK